MKNQEGGNPFKPGSRVRKSLDKMYKARKHARNESGKTMLKDLNRMAIEYVRKDLEDEESTKHRKKVLREISAGIETNGEEDVEAIIDKRDEYLKYKSTLGINTNAKSEVRVVLEKIANDPVYVTTDTDLQDLIFQKVDIDQELLETCREILGGHKVERALLLRNNALKAQQAQEAKEAKEAQAQAQAQAQQEKEAQQEQQKQQEEAQAQASPPPSYAPGHAGYFESQHATAPPEYSKGETEILHFLRKIDDGINHIIKYSLD